MRHTFYKIELKKFDLEISKTQGLSDLVISPRPVSLKAQQTSKSALTRQNLRLKLILVLSKTLDLGL